MWLFSLRRHPVLLLLVSLAAGIVCAEWCFFHFHTAFVPSWWVFVPMLPAVWLLLAHRLGRTSRHDYRREFALMALLFFFVTGWLLARRALPPSQTSPGAPMQTCVVTLRDYPLIKPRSIACTAEERAGRKLLLYFAPDSAARQLQPNQVVRIKSRLLPLDSVRTLSSSYIRYLQHHGIGATGYVASGRWEVVGYDTLPSLERWAEQARRALTRHYRRLGFRDENLAVLSALTIGNKASLTGEVRETYSAAGVSHVLAISGLHVGLLYAFLLLLFRRVLRFRLLPTALCCCVLLWGFAFLAGCSASTVRAVGMCSLLAVASLFTFRALPTVDAVIFAAFGMLLFRPLWLFDAGFQLSFAAVLFMVWLLPRFGQLRWIRSRRLRPAAELLLVALVAQAGTAPLVILYFSRFPLHFLLTNLVVLPLTTLIVYGTIPMLLLSPLCPTLEQGVAWMVNLLLTLQNRFLGWVGQLPGTSLVHLHVDVWEVALYYLLCFWWVRFLSTRRAGHLQAALCVLLALVVKICFF
ncbi:MAG: ComEC family competence protein [Prevotellaceae bacterium]|nr:ComEC family competence protein [Prevotellaceae bacterium]